jgi:nucleoside phosphorylase
MKSNRYQDLSRQQAFGLETRILQRLAPLLVIREGTRRADVDAYFSSLLDLSHTLTAVALGNIPMDDAATVGKKLNAQLRHATLFKEESQPAANAVLCVTDALGDLQLIRYNFAPGLPARDRENPDVDSLIAAGAWTLSKLGMMATVFKEPPQVDCHFILEHRKGADVYLSPTFFSRPLWPTVEHPKSNDGMPFALTRIIFEDWKQSLYSLDLRGIVASYEGCLEGIFTKKNEKVMSKQSSQSIDIAILVALQKELDAVLASAGSWNRHQDSSDIRTYYTSATITGLSVLAARSSGMGQINAALLARDVVAHFKPHKVLLVGIAGGLGNEICLGDIVVSDQVVDYEVGKVTVGGVKPRWSVYRSDALLRERLLDHHDPSWLARIKVPRPDGDKSARPAIRSGVVLSGNKVFANAAEAGVLADVWSRAAAIEMEAAGVAAALHQSADPPPGFVMVKAICDRADAAKDDLWQEYAAEVAAAFVTSHVFGHLQPSDAKAQKKEKNLPQPSAGGIELRALRLALSAAYDLRELKILVSDLELDWDNIAGDIKDEKIVELIWHFKRRERLERLIRVVRKERPGLLDAFSPGI